MAIDRTLTVQEQAAELSALAAKIGQCLLQRGMMLAAAESCTGGWAAQALTSVAGSSQWFERGFVTYSNDAKQEMLGVSNDILSACGAVSERAVQAMAEGGLKNSHAQVSLAISGVAGPDGGRDGKPVGTVYLAWAMSGAETVVRHELFSGDRDEIRRQSVVAALQGVLDIVTIQV